MDELVCTRATVVAAFAISIGLWAACDQGAKKSDVRQPDLPAPSEVEGSDVAPSDVSDVSDAVPSSDLSDVAPSDVSDVSDAVPSSDVSDVAPSDLSDVAPSDAPAPVDCGFLFQFEPYDPGTMPAMLPPRLPQRLPVDPGEGTRGVDHIAWLDPDPPSLSKLSLDGREDIVLPGYEDNLPLFVRAEQWFEPYRCYELPGGSVNLSEDEAFDLYREIGERTTGQPMDVSPGARTVVGLRGAYPGTFAWNGNDPDLFNDTLVLLWRDAEGKRHVREFPVNTDSGAYEFGEHNSSSLRPNRVYPYVNGWHKTYNALHIDEDGYQVRDDANKNGHWDSDRNGWYPPQTEPDHDRAGGGHNIHMASVDGPLGYAHVQNWSAGCQTIPGIANWKEFIARAWTAMGDPVSYYLIDVRDIDPGVWYDCPQQDGTRICPFRVKSFPHTDARNTADSKSAQFPMYNCSPANESGPEYFYVFDLTQPATVHVKVDDIAGTGPDIDVHLLDGDSPLACLARDDVAFSLWVPPGRYWVVADTYMEGGNALVGPYVLDLWLE